MITRGPKPARVLRELGLQPGLAAATPTSRGVLDALAGEDIGGRGIGVQLYPGAPGSLLAALHDRGAVRLRNALSLRLAGRGRASGRRDP